MSSQYNLLNDIPTDILPQKIFSVELIKGGLNNQNILVNDTLLLKKFCRRDELNDPMKDRFSREIEVLKQLNHQSYSPVLLNRVSKDFNLIFSRNWIEGHPITVEQIKNDPKLLIALVKTLILVHKNDFVTSCDYDYFDVIRRYLKEYEIINKKYINQVKIKDFSNLPSYKSLNLYFLKQFNCIEKDKSVNKFVRIHGDLVFSNIIIEKKSKQVILIDWEYSTIGSLYMDLAYLLTQNPFTKSLDHQFITLYEKEGNTIINTQILTYYKNIMNLMAGLWYIIHSIRIFESRIKEITKLDFSEFLLLGKERLKALNIS